MKQDKEFRHAMTVKVNSEVANNREYCLQVLNADEATMDSAKRELVLRALQKKDYIRGFEGLYKKLGDKLRLKQQHTEQEAKYLAFLRKNSIL